MLICLCDNHTPVCVHDWVQKMAVDGDFKYVSIATSNELEQTSFTGIEAKSVLIVVTELETVKRPFIECLNTSISRAQYEVVFLIHASLKKFLNDYLGE